MNETKDISKLVADVQNGVDGAFDELYKRTVRFAYGTASLFLDNDEDIEDVLQTSYMYVSQSIESLRNKDSFMRWLRTIVKHECQKLLIGGKKKINAVPIDIDENENEPVCEDEGAAELIERSELRARVQKILDKLPESKRICIVLFYFEQNSVEEIAHILDVPVGTVKSRLHSARKKLEKEFEALRKNDDKFFGLAAIPTVTALLAYQVKNAAVPAAVEKSVIATVAASGSVASTAGAAGTAAVTGGASAAGTVTVTSTAASAVAVKVVAIAVSACAVTGGAVATKNYIESKMQETTAVIKEESVSEEVTGTAELVITDLASETESETIPEFTQNNTSLFASVPYTTLRGESTAFSQTQTTTISITHTERTTVRATAATAPTTAKPTTTATPTTTAPATTSLSETFAVSGGVLSEYKGADAKVNVPSSVNGETVTSIGIGAFSGNTSVTSLILPSGVTKIGQEAFSDCIKLSSVSLPSTLKSIGIGAFYGCTSLKNISIPNGVQSIGDDAFAECSGLTGITIPDSVTSIGDYAFDGCGSLVIKCSEGSAAYKYAVDNGIDFVII